MSPPASFLVDKQPRLHTPRWPRNKGVQMTGEVRLRAGGLDESSAMPLRPALSLSGRREEGDGDL